jgi:hypothetical protein
MDSKKLFLLYFLMERFGIQHIYHDEVITLNRFGRGQPKTYSRRKRNSNHLRFMVFDSPEASSHDLSFEESQPILIGKIPHDHPFIVHVDSISCNGEHHILTLLSIDSFFSFTDIKYGRIY